MDYHLSGDYGQSGNQQCNLLGRTPTTLEVRESALPGLKHCFNENYDSD